MGHPSINPIKAPMRRSPLPIQRPRESRYCRPKKETATAAPIRLLIGFPIATLAIKVKIIADPNAKYNTHEIEATGDFGKIKTTTNNLPSKNPRTSYLAVLSAMQTIKNMGSNLKIGS